MDRFDLARLTDFDFERVCKDIFEVELGTPLEIFAPGADAGVDLRYVAPDGARTVIQCKHWHRSGRSALVNYIKRVEADKVAALAPERYILATSVDLTSRAKDSLMKALSPYIQTPADLWGVAELEAALAANEAIVRRHLRLWMSSAAVLTTLLGREVLLRSADLRHDIDDTLLRFAPSTALADAQEILERNKVCIISGIPGVGKTTLAQVLAAQHISTGYELIEIARDIDEALRLWDDSRLQIFYYDDFLGQTSLRDTVATNEDGRLLRFIKQVERAGNKAFVLTTREYILAQARQASEKLNTRSLDVAQYLLDLRSYSQITRAEVLYNHIYFSKLPEGNRAAFADPAAYGPIIRHRNFNPRLIALTLDSPSTLTESPTESVERVRQNLNDPRALWDHMFRFQLSPEEVNVAEVVFLSGAAVDLAELTSLWLAYAHRTPAPQDGRELRRILGSLEGTLIRLDMQNEMTLVRFHNPSVRDYMRSRISTQPEVLSAALNGISSLTQLEVLWATATGYDGQALLELLIQRADALEALFTSKTAIRAAPEWPDWAERAAVLVDVADRLNSSPLAAVIAEIVRDYRPEYIEDPGGYPELIMAIRQSRFAAIREAEESLLDWIIEELTQDLADWSWARTVADTLASIGGERSKQEAARVEELLDEKARDEAEHLANGGRSYASESEAEEMLERLNAFDNPEEEFEGYRQLSRSVESSRARREQQARSVPPSAAAPDSEVRKANDLAIGTMMASLKRDTVDES